MRLSRFPWFNTPARPAPTPFDALDRYPVDVIAQADDLVAVAASLGLSRPLTGERIYREILAERVAS